MAPRISPLRDFLHRESSSGIVVLLASALGLITANSAFAKQYFEFFAWNFSIGSEELYLKLSTLKIINYILMTIFFFVVGLEIKRELTSGHLQTFKKAIIPFVAAVGGMALPAVIYLLIAGDVAANGWGVPVATDIALAVGLLALFGNTVVASLRSFLLALAVIDDIGAILIIALVYSTGVQISWAMAAALAVIAIFIFQRAGTHSVTIYVLLGFLLWYCLYRTGVHPTLAGVILGLMTPNIPRHNSGLIDTHDGSVSVIEWLEKKLHPWSTFFVVPIFAFANTGVEISMDSLAAAKNSPIAWGIFFGLVIGKPLGIVATVVLAKKIRLGDLPEGSNTQSILATGSAAGIGFTVAIFIANLAFPDRATQEVAIFSIICASIISGLLSWFSFKFVARKDISK